MAKKQAVTQEQLQQLAERASVLTYVNDADPGIRRKRIRDRFAYIGVDGKPVRDDDTLERIRKLGIPPAWEDVWICTDPNGHIQATGRDAKGRKQYRYHVSWQTKQNETKFDKMITFAEKLPTMREQTERDLALRGLPREKVLATVIRLLESTLIRVGNMEYAKSNKSFGLTTLHDKHVDVQGEQVHFAFRGKSGVKHTIDIRDRRLARVVKQCRDIPGQHLFQYVDADGQRVAITSSDVNRYLKEISGEDFTAKDFRTWGGTVVAAAALRDLAEFESETQAKKNIVAAINAASQQLGNTKTVCRKYYVHPAIIDAYMDGSLLTAFRAETENGDETGYGLRPAERVVVSLLRTRADIMKG